MIGEPMKQSSFTLQSLYKEGKRQLKEAGVAEADLDAWYLLEEITGVDKAAYYGKPDRRISGEEKDRYQTLLEQRKKRVPLQYILGKQEFFGRTFRVGKGVLIPRQETELLVEETLKKLHGQERVLDLCTGSGCVIISLKLQKPSISAVGSDVSQAALAVAEENAKRLDAQVEFRQGSLFEKIGGKYDLIVSNPPYIPSRVIETLQEEVRIYEPRLALDGEEDGLGFYRVMVKEAGDHLHPGGWLLFEIGHDQGQQVADLMRENGYIQVAVKKDLAGLDRVVLGMYNRF